MEGDGLLHKEEKSSPNEEPVRGEESDKGKSAEADEPPKNAGGWGWGFSAFSVLSDLQKAAEEISRNAAAVAEKAAKSIADLQEDDEDSESASKEEEKTEEPDKEQQSDDEKEKVRKSALDKLENASEDTLLSQSLKVLDNSVETLTSGAWQALGNAWKGGTSLVQKLENSIQQGGSPRTSGSVAPSLLETGKALTAKGMQVLEYVGKETIDLLITETGTDVEKKREGLASGDQLHEEVTFDRCFYIYGGPEQLEELEALSSHYALLFNRRKVKLSPDQKSLYDGKLKQIQQIFSFVNGIGGSNAESNKGKKIETESETGDDEMKNLRDSSVSEAADMAAGFANALTGLNSINDMIQRTDGRLESLHSEGVHRLSEMCCFAVTHLLILGKSIISQANKVDGEDSDLNIEWPEDPTEKAKMIRGKAESMMGYVEAVAESFITGISDVTEAYVHAAKGIAAKPESKDEHPKASTGLDKGNGFTQLLRSDKTTAIAKIQEGLQHLSHVVISTSMPSSP
ncbi:PREDICTED: uncharacterized protein LOC104807346 [Tarenaya hassleriana]|uniref:uncharacterized protein LOC104807346 n=1 Tax=Tarenaya hassleriana TaxID=28532 RepID=UPI00053C196A|nr:PREDICTED: uncharacterized protein LOC104807346 [Tarenaya hassleriana]XP_010530872.1 PREDICTED: uncharacterized protein LOC104807346 [Tarenaya hassleriana]